MMKRQDSLLPMRIVLITGISGSGKSVALNALEDAGYYCVDNLPPHVLPELARYLAEDGQHRLAVAIDARSSASLDEMPGLIRALSLEHDVRVLFLNASTQSLIQRFSETRRRHPLSGSPSHDANVGLLSSLEEAIERERELVAPLAEFGHQIDTSTLRANAAHLGQALHRAEEQRPDGDVRIVRLQARRAARRRPDVRRARAAESVLRPRAAPAHRARPAGHRVSRRTADRPSDDRRHPCVPDEMVAALSRGQPQLSDRRHRLYRRPASLGVHRGNARRAPRARCERDRAAS
jgi:hypothetical protein